MLKFFTTFIFTAALLVSSNAYAQDLTWENLLVAAMNLDKSFDYEANADSYMQRLRSDIWSRYQDDEFELDDKRQETIKMMRERAANFNAQDEFVIRTKFEFGKYDFSAQRFPMSPFSEVAYYYADADYTGGDLPYRFKLFFSNLGKVDGLAMEKAAAKSFIQKRKNQYGQINRIVYATIHIKVIKLKEKDSLLGEITAVEVYDDTSHQNLLAKY